MTATTAHGLIYQVGGDRPCDAPAAWCALTATLEAQLFATDQLIGRVDPTISMAKMTRDTDEVFVTSTSLIFPIRFEGVEVDTDDMVDFGVSQFSIKPRRFGTYFVSASCSILSNDVDNLQLTLTRGAVLTNTTSATYNAQATETVSRGALTDPFNLKISAHLSFESDDTVGFGVILNPLDSGTLTLLYANISAYWVSDVAVNG